jgi:maltose phosphorylase
MAGTWMAFVKGFGGMRVYDDMVQFSPFLPAGWKGYAFKVRWRGYYLKVKASRKGTTIVNHSDEEIRLKVFGKEYDIKGNDELAVAMVPK